LAHTIVRSTFAELDSAEKVRNRGNLARHTAERSEFLISRLAVVVLLQDGYVSRAVSMMGLDLVQRVLLVGRSNGDRLDIGLLVIRYMKTVSWLNDTFELQAVRRLMFCS
jgi:hypothetical protein